MKKTYQVTGMTCNGCRNGVEEKLSKVAGITKASVSLEDHAATLESDQPIPLAILRNALSDKYTIVEQSASTSIQQKSVAPVVTMKEPSEWRQLFPLFLILTYITVAAILLNNDPWNGGEFMLDFMGLFYIVFGFFKLLDLKGFPDSFRMYDPLAKVFPAYGWIYPFLETALGILFLMRTQVQFALIVTVIILGITTIGVMRTLLDKKQIQCACLGTALKLPMTKATFIENTIMLVMAFWMLLR